MNTPNCLLITFLLAGCLWLIIISTIALAEPHMIKHVLKSDRSIRFLAVGDTGRKGERNQSEIAIQMGIIGELLDIDFVLLAGDNFYPHGLDRSLGVNDTAFDESYVNIYTADSLKDIPWYAVEGNHDYQGDAMAQFSEILRKKDSRWNCYKRLYILNAEIADFFFLDTTAFLNIYFDKPKEHTYDWTDITNDYTYDPKKHRYHWGDIKPSLEKYRKELLQEMRLALEKSAADIKVVVGHHPIRSAGDNGDTKELKEHLLPILKDNNVRFYINGHDHCLEHIVGLEGDNLGPIQFLTSGGGSKAWAGTIRDIDPREKIFYYDGEGFLAAHITESHTSMQFYNIKGEVIHEWEIDKQGQMHIGPKVG